MEIPNPESEWRRINEREWRRTDEWGNVWSRVDDTSKSQVIEGALENLKAKEVFKLWRGRGGFIAGYYTDNQGLL